MDSVLADSSEIVYRILDTDYGVEDQETWEWPHDKFGTDTFLGAFGTAWTDYWKAIRPMEEALPATVAELGDRFHITVVTSQPDDDEIVHGKKMWLDRHGIPRDGFRTVGKGETKAALNYDVYIDDKPALPQRVAELNPDARMFLRDRPYNQGAVGPYTRVESVEDALREMVMVA